jgi:hypothetical protein
MPNYKATRKNHYKIYFAVDFTEAQQIADQFGTGWSVEQTNDPIPTPTPAEIVQMNVEFGNSLVNMFMVDNAEIGVIPESESLALLAKFQQVLPLAQLGSIKVVSELLPTLTTDAYFTQTRKDKYINLIAQYLAQF